MKPNKKGASCWLAAACAVLVLVGGSGVLYYRQNCTVASVVSLDVNPSMELKVSRNEKVLSCTALNEEAAAVLFSMGGGADLKGAKVEVAVNAIMGALVRAGYLDSPSSAILISVEDNDQDRAARLQAELVACVDGVLQTEASGASVLSQVLTVDALALDDTPHDGGGLSFGKAALVRKMMEMSGADDDAAFEQLAALSVEELNDLLEAGETRIPVGMHAAALAVEIYAGTLAFDSTSVDVDPELDEMPPHYDVELHTAWGEFEYIVDAFTGEVLSGPASIVAPAFSETPDALQPGAETQPPATQQPVVPDPPSQGSDVGQAAAKRAALAHAGLNEGDVTGWKIERGWDNGRLEYEIEFWCGTTEYEYTIDGHSCSVLKHEQEHHQEDTHYNDGEHHGNSHHGSTDSGNTTDIGRVAAKAAALNHAGVSESQTTQLKVEQDWDDGRLEYEVEFKANGMEYEYTIDGTTGAILEYESELDD